jgi:DNA replicative helicase MCM subunit Mcm2 (Cdc46/Mcm family)
LSRKKVKKVVVKATSIKYVNRKELVITPRDTEAINKFASYPNLAERLTAMFAPNVIGHNHIKLAVLRSVVGGHDRGQRGGGRINMFLVGDPGTAKSTIGQEAAKIKPNSRHVSAPHASSKTITAIAEKENETVSLKLGAIPLARNAICAIDEITEFPLEEQGRLLSILEEGEFPLDKHGRSWRIPAPTAIIATANPIGSRWSSRDVISTDEINMRKTLLDRFQQVYYFRDDIAKEQIDSFVNAMSDINKRRPHNYNFLTKYILHASSIEFKTVTREAELMLNQFWKDAKIERNVGVRMYRALYSISEAHAKLQLKDTIDANIAKETIELMQLMMAQTGSTVKAPSDPKVVTYEKFIEILQNNKAGVAIKALCEIACKEIPQIVLYLGKNWSLDGNIKLRSVVTMLRNHSQVKETNGNPLVFQWIGPPTPDASDSPDTTILKKNDERQPPSSNSTTEGVSEASEASDRIAQISSCDICGEVVDPDQYYQKLHRCEGTD